MPRQPGHDAEQTRNERIRTFRNRTEKLLKPNIPVREHATFQGTTCLGRVGSLYEIYGKETYRCNTCGKTGLFVEPTHDAPSL